jgi:hypothetical protein
VFSVCAVERTLFPKFFKDGEMSSQKSPVLKSSNYVSINMFWFSKSHLFLRKWFSRRYTKNSCVAANWYSRSWNTRNLWDISNNLTEIYVLSFSKYQKTNLTRTRHQSAMHPIMLKSHHKYGHATNAPSGTITPQCIKFLRHVEIPKLARKSVLRKTQFYSVRKGSCTNIHDV